jgi:hypothetical protein
MTTNGSTPWQLSLSEKFPVMDAIEAAYEATCASTVGDPGHRTLNRRQSRYFHQMISLQLRPYASQRGIRRNHPSTPMRGLEIMLACRRVRNHVDKQKKRTTKRKVVSKKYPYMTLTDYKKVLRILVGMRLAVWTAYNKAVLESKASRASVVVVCVCE